MKILKNVHSYNFLKIKFLQKFKIALKNASIAYMNLFINRGSLIRLTHSQVQPGQCQNIKSWLRGQILVIVMHMHIAIAHIHIRLSLDSTWKLYPVPAAFLFLDCWKMDTEKSIKQRITPDVYKLICHMSLVQRAWKSGCAQWHFTNLIITP